MKKQIGLGLGFFFLFFVLQGCSSTTPQQIKSQEGSLYNYKSDSNGFDTKNFFYDNGEEIVVFDTQFTADYAKKSLAYIRSKSSNPITHVVITHPNPDKFNGMQVFQKLGAKVVASQKTIDALAKVHAYKKYYFVKIAKMFTDKTYPALGKVDVAFESSHSLRLKNGEVIELTELGTAGVSSNQTIAYIKNKNAYIVGDLIHHKAHAWLEGSVLEGKATLQVQNWTDTLDKLALLGKESTEAKVYGGRGEAANLQEAIQAQKAYLQKVDSIVDTYLKNLGERKAELAGDKAQGHYNALQKELVKAFPDHTLPYMIGYGIYGLVQTKLR